MTTAVEHDRSADNVTLLGPYLKKLSASAPVSWSPHSWHPAAMLWWCLNCPSFIIEEDDNWMVHWVGGKGGVYSAERTIVCSAAMRHKTVCRAEELGAFSYSWSYKPYWRCSQTKVESRRRYLRSEGNVVGNLGVLLFCCLSSRAIWYRVCIRQMLWTVGRWVWGS